MQLALDSGTSKNQGLDGMCRFESTASLKMQGRAEMGHAELAFLLEDFRCGWALRTAKQLPIG